MRNNIINIKKITICLYTTLLLLLLTSCLSFYKIPDEYVTDEELVFLKQRKELNPISYTPELTEPYKWDVNIKVNAENPDILKKRAFSKLLNPDLESDAKLYLEVKEHLQYIAGSEKFLELKTMLETHEFIPPMKNKIVKGDKSKNYTNGTEYEYPLSSGSKIIYFNDGNYEITFSNKNVYTETKVGNYFEVDSKGNEVFAVFPSHDSYRDNKNGIKYSKTGEQKSVSTKEGEFVFLPSPIPQYQFKPANTKNEYIFFLTDDNVIENIALVDSDNIRYDYDKAENNVMASYKSQAVVINNNFSKQHTKFDPIKGSTGEVISVYFPEGLKITGLNEKVSYSELNPLWPEKYIYKNIGGFKIYYVKEDQKYLSNISSAKLKEILSFVKDKSGLPCTGARSVILPPNLESYRKLHAGDRNELMNWYPSGFQTKDMIIMWPPSVKRYHSEEGEKYFWNNEFYDIFLHELVHLIIGQSTRIFSPVPVWLNEGMAVYIESLWSQETQSYWETSFDVSFNLNQLLSWDEISEKNTSFFPVTKARVHYSQSYKMAQFLYETYGKNKMTNYINSFSVEFQDISNIEIKNKYKESFEEVFGLTWEENLDIFNDSITNSIN